MLDAVWFMLGGMAVIFSVLLLLLGAVTALNRWVKPTPGAKAQGEAGSSSSSNPERERHGNA